MLPCPCMPITPGRWPGSPAPLTIELKGTAARGVEASKSWYDMKLSLFWAVSVFSCGLDLRGRGRAVGRGGVVGESGLEGEVAPLFGGDVPVTLGDRAGERSVAGGEGALEWLWVGNPPGGYGPVDWRSPNSGLPVGDGERLWPKRDMGICAGAITLISSSDPTFRALIAEVSTLGTAASSSWAMAREMWWGSRSECGWGEVSCSMSRSKIALDDE